MHELDHLNGKTMTHWALSEGNIDILRGFELENQNLMSTVDFYKHKIDSAKKNFQDLFDDHRKYEKVVVDGKEWKSFENNL